MSVSNFNRDFDLDYQREITQAVNNMIKKYLPNAYSLIHTLKVDQMIMCSIFKGCIGEEHNELYRQVQFKKRWFLRNNEIVLQIKNHVSKRKCNNCKKAYVDCRNTCYKHKTNPRPIEFPQDVFNVIKDYLGVYDIPKPVTELMSMMKLKNIKEQRKIKNTLGNFVSIKNLKNHSVAEKVGLYNAHLIRSIKGFQHSNTSMIKRSNTGILELANKYPEFRFGKELTDNNKIFLIRLLYERQYIGLDHEGFDDTNTLFEFMRGCCGISLNKNHNVKNPKPYVMYKQEDHFNSDYSVRNLSYDMFDFYFEMDCSDDTKISSYV